MSRLTVKRLKEVLRYDPESGAFIWKVNKSPGILGQLAGSLTNQLYIKIQIDGFQYKAHRLAWLYVTEVWPTDLIDHINGNHHDNRFNNLREANRRTNGENRKRCQKDNKTGFLGVTFCKSSSINPWAATIKVNGKKIHIGLFPTPEEAHEAYLEIKRNFHQGCTL